MSMESHGGMISAGKTDSSTTVLWQSYQHRYLVTNEEELGEGNCEFGLRNIFCSYFEVILTYLKILRHGANGSTSLLKEGVLRIFIASTRFEPASPGFSGKYAYANHYSTEATEVEFTLLSAQICNLPIN
jgi:hypothetical protein